MKRRKKNASRTAFHSVLLIVLFCAYIGLFAVLYIALPHKDFSENEKRALADFPQASLATVFDGSFEADFETWLSDHVPGRNVLVGLHSYYGLASGRNGLGGVVLGDDNRLFSAPEDMDADALVRKCERINTLAETTGLPTSVMLIPTSGYMLDESLPMLHAPYHDAAVAETIAASLAESVDFIWPEQQFAALEGEELYYRTDHHLTSRGSYEAYKIFAESVNVAAPDASNYDVQTARGFYGSMYAKAGLWSVLGEDVEIWRSRTLENVTVSFDDREPADSMFFTDHLAEMDKYPVFLDGNHALVTIDTGRTGGENLLIVRDSFGHCFAPFAADNFDKIVLVDLRYYRLPISELVKEQEIDRMLVLYGVDTFLTDTNFAWMK